MKNGTENGRGKRRQGGSRCRKAGMLGRITIFLKLYLWNLYSLIKNLFDKKEKERGNETRVQKVFASILARLFLEIPEHKHTCTSVIRLTWLHLL